MGEAARFHSLVQLWVGCDGGRWSIQDSDVSDIAVGDLFSVLIVKQ
jgi:hypothetical protein